MLQTRGSSVTVTLASMSSGKKYGKGRVSQAQGPPRVSEKAADGPPVELENQFIMRLPGGEQLRVSTDNANVYHSQRSRPAR